MKKVFLCLSGMLLILLGSAHATPVQYTVNGHWYEIVLESIEWEDAHNEADALSYNDLSGYLVTVTSQAEWDFILALPNFRDALWLGGFQPAGSAEPDGGWEWVTGEPFVFTAWNTPFEPNDALGDNGGEMYIETNVLGSWNDNGIGERAGYIVEYDNVDYGSPVPEPATILLIGSGIAGLAGLRIRRKKK